MLKVAFAKNAKLSFLKLLGIFLHHMVKLIKNQIYFYFKNLL